MGARVRDAQKVSVLVLISIALDSEDEIYLLVVEDVIPCIFQLYEPTRVYMYTPL